MSVLTDPATSAAPSVVVADLDRRFYAYVLDRVIGWGLAVAAGALVWYVVGQHDWRVVGGVGLLVLVVVSVVLAVLQGTSGATPGKSAVGIRTMTADGGRPAGVGVCVRRGLLLGLAGLPTAGLGVATLAWTAAADAGGARRAWHDRRCGTTVVNVRHRLAPAVVAAPAPAPMVNLTALRLAQAARPAPPAVVEPPVQDAPVTRATDRPTNRPTDDEPAPRPRAAAAAPAPPTTAAPPAPADPATSEPDRRTPLPREAGRRLAGPLRSAEPLEPVATRWRVTFDSGESVVLEGVLLVGRGPQPRAGEQVRHLVPLRSSDMSLSKTHAQLHVAGDGVLVVTDRGSTNGSMILRRGMSRELTAGRPATLVDGDRVRFGDREMRVDREPEVP